MKLPPLCPGPVPWLPAGMPSSAGVARALDPHDQARLASIRLDWGPKEQTRSSGAEWASLRAVHYQQATKVSFIGVTTTSIGTAGAVIRSE